MSELFTAKQVANGDIEHYAFPGGYDVTVSDNRGHVFHAACAEEDAIEYVDDEPDRYVETPRLFQPFVHWEGEPLICDACGEAIPSVYGNPDPQEAGDDE